MYYTCFCMHATTLSRCLSLDHLPHRGLEAWGTESIWVDRLGGGCEGAGRAWDQAGSPGIGVAMWAPMQKQGYE